uniref:WASH complex subunit strumpellin n=1 Tax=Ascaris lumbricoides TaxID=6252 RepID=A0A0M3IUQ9_ASCLU
MESLVYDILHHIFFKVYTSTTVDHENDHLLGALLVLSQIKFAEKGFRSFNRIMRHIEAKGSLNYPGLVTHITNMAILEEISRVHEYCTEYVNIQVALPQVHRGTKDGQRQALEEQMKKWRNDPIETVAGYFTDENENILKMLESRIRTRLVY